MTGEWRTSTVADLQRQGVLLVEDGNHGEYRPRPDEFVDDGVAFIRAADMDASRVLFESASKINERARQRITKGIGAPGDVLLSHKGTVGKVALVPENAPPFVCSPQTTLWRTLDPELLDRKYLYAFLRGPGFHVQLAARAGETDMAPYVSLTSQRALSVTLPSIDVQRAIAHILGTLDDKIELNRRMNETLEAMARALFKSWFVDFLPVRAKMAARTQTGDPVRLPAEGSVQAGAKHALSKVEGAEGRPSRTSGQTFSGLPKHLADLFPDSFEGSELGEIPKGWAVKTIEAIATRVGMGPFGSSIKVETFVPAGVPVISGQHLHGFMVEDNTFNFVAPEHAERLKNAIVQRGDVVFTHAGNIGQAAYIPENSRYDRYVISQRQFFMRCDPAQVTPSFVAFYFRSPEGQHRLLANASSSGVPSIARPVTYLRSIQLSIPPNPIMDAFEKLVQPLLLQFRRNLNEVSTLATLRDTLLPKLISGELRVTGLEQAIPGDGHREVERDSRKQP